ncbi:MAG TPA: YCF48-related protein, partial [Puia sp.]|nr:YCF48-related protein [Puia sp.]
SAVGFYGDNTGGGLYKTTDGGNNWTSVFNVPSVPDNFYPYFLNQDTGFVATNSGVFAGTTDGGLTWNTKNNITNPSSSGTYNQLQFLNAKDGYYGCHVGVMKTTDGGQTWNNIMPGETGNNVNVIKFFDTQSGYYKGSTTIYHTTDAGQTWTISCRIGSGFFIGMNFLDAHTGWVCTAKGRVFRIQD